MAGIRLLFKLLLFNQVGVPSDTLVKALCYESVGTQHTVAQTISGKEEDLPAFTIQISNVGIVLDPQLQNGGVSLQYAGINFCLFTPSVPDQAVTTATYRPVS